MEFRLKLLLFPVLAELVAGQNELPPIIKSIPSANLIAKSDPVCTPSQINDVLSCYARFLSLYDLQVEQTNFRSVLPRFSLLSYRIMSSPLAQICSTWSVVESCIGPISLLCINRSAFNEITNSPRDAADYVENHAFFEYACGAGNAYFTANEDCLSRSLTASPVSRRILDCGGQDPLSPDPSYYCANALTSLACVRDGMTRECGPSAAYAICSATTQIARRIGDVDGSCLPEMQLTCATSNLIQRLLFPLIWLLLVIRSSL